MTTRHPDEIRAEIDQTRATLANDAERLTEKVSPSKIVERKVDGLKGTVSGIREKVVGPAQDLGSAAGGAVSGASSSVGHAATGIADAAASAPAAAKVQAQGSPLIAGAVAFGLGWLASNLLPATAKERQLGASVKEHAADLKQPAKDVLTTAAAEVREQLAPQAAQAAESVKEVAMNATATVQETAADRAGDVTETATQAAAHVKETAAPAPAYPVEQPTQAFSVPGRPTI